MARPKSPAKFTRSSSLRKTSTSKSINSATSKQSDGYSSTRSSTLKERLSLLTLESAKALLGDDASNLLTRGAQREVSISKHVYVGTDLFRLTIPGTSRRAEAIVTIVTVRNPLVGLRCSCTVCSQPCEHIGTALSLILEEKSALGLSKKVAKNQKANVVLSEEDLVDAALTERQNRADVEEMSVEAADRSIPWTDYKVTSAASGKTYRVALRGTNPGDSFCTCPDFRTNTLGTCKHILHVLRKVRRRFRTKVLAIAYQHASISVAIQYGDQLELRVLLPQSLDSESEAIIGRLRGQSIEDIPDLLKRIRHLERLGQQITIYPDAEEFIQQQLFQATIAERVAAIRSSPADHPLRTSLLKVQLLPYQLDGIAFAVGAGRAILADEMGLGKTIQGIGVAELLARESGISRVLVICPASLKSQWKNEIEQFSARSVQLVEGASAERIERYSNQNFFTICNYEQVLRDIGEIENRSWDLIILDEGQRIKNWESKTTRVIKGLKSRFALVLTGTPLENRLDDLFSIVQFIDERRLGPGFRFFHRHRILDDKGKIRGYKNLDEVRERLAPVLLRRTRQSVQQQLPPRKDQIVRIAPTNEQLELSNYHLQAVAKIVSKPFLTEMDFLALQRQLLFCRMAANSTFLIEKEPPGHSSKLERLDELLESLLYEPTRKIVVFSEWTTMLDLIESLIQKRDQPFVRLDGSVPQKHRQTLIERFQNDDKCRIFLMTNAGSTGLNLQSADTIINVDLPWNPAVLEQRIARAYRMGQKRPVSVYILVTEQTLEERLLTTLANKQELALAALDPESDTDEVHLESSLVEIKRRLTSLLEPTPSPVINGTPAKPEASMPSSQNEHERIAAAGAQFFASAVDFLCELVPQGSDTAASRQIADSLRKGLSQLVDHDDGGHPRITFALPSESILDRLVDALSRVVGR